LCSDINYTILQKGSQWVYEDLSGKYKMLHYSGDTDGAVPTVGTFGWLDSMNLDIVQEWTPYFWADQVAGYTIEYAGNITMGTVHGCGHMAPQWKRPETFHLIFSFINGTAV